MKVLITGAGGFVGRHLAAELHGAGHELVLTDKDAGSVKLPDQTDAAIRPCDIRNGEEMIKVFAETKPDAVVHLAAVSHIVTAQKEHELLSSINHVGTHNVCVAASRMQRPVTFLFVSSSFVYGSNPPGQARHPEQSEGSRHPEQPRHPEQSEGSQPIALSEKSPVNPDTAYGRSKLAGEMIVRTFASENFKPYIVRPFNHTGPGQSTDFVCPGLAKKIAEAPDGGTVKVGNLDAWRDFTDVRDVVRAYRLVLEKRPVEDLFVIGSGKPVQIRTIFETLVGLSGKQLTVTVDHSLLRSKDPQHLCADPRLANSVLSWSVNTSLADTLQKMLRQVK